MAEFHHYFVSANQKKEDFFSFCEEFGGKSFCFFSADDIFSKNQIDYGTKVLLQCLIKEPLKGDILDIGCGYGVIGIVLASFFPKAKISFSDINETAVALTEQNIAKNKIGNVEKPMLSNIYEKIDSKFDVIVSNPPIKAGKEVLHAFLFGAKEHLNKGGILYFVIKSKFGAKTLVQKLREVYETVEIIERDGGFFVVKAVA